MTQFFYDWSKISQDHSVTLPQVSDIRIETIDVITGERLSSKQPYFFHEGSFSTKIKIQIIGNRVTLDGNLSRYNRLDNFLGFTSLDQMMVVANSILAEYDLPPFTKCTEKGFSQSSQCENTIISDGAYFQRLDLTTNVAVGKGNVDAYLKSLSTLRAGYSVGYLYPNGKTVDWRSLKGIIRLIYRKAYDKAYELMIHLLPKIKRQFGEASSEYHYVLNLINYCIEQGIARFEQSLRTEFLKREGCHYWGLFDEAKLMNIQTNFLNIDNNLKVTAIEYESISEALVRVGACESIRSANITAIHAMNWKDGRLFNGSERSYKTHRARLRKIGIDIASPYQADRHNVITFVRDKREVVVNKEVTPPNWYKMPCHLRAVGG